MKEFTKDMLKIGRIIKSSTAGYGIVVKNKEIAWLNGKHSEDYMNHVKNCSGVYPLALYEVNSGFALSYFLSSRGTEYLDMIWKHDSSKSEMTHADIKECEELMKALEKKLKRLILR